jgi:hypothetical protein
MNCRGKEEPIFVTIKDSLLKRISIIEIVFEDEEKVIERG